MRYISNTQSLFYFLTFFLFFEYLSVGEDPGNKKSKKTFSRFKPKLGI